MEKLIFILLLMLANPMPILIFTAAFTALGFQGWKGDHISTAILVIWVFFGSTFWAPILGIAVSRLGPQLSHGELQIVNRISGIMIFVFGVVLGIMALIGRLL